MKLYLANGKYVGTQADAKRIDKDFEPVEVPTDKESLIAYLNNIARWRGNDPVCPNDESEAYAPVAMSYSEMSAAMDKGFESLPIEHQLTLSNLALENAIAEIGRLKANQRGGGYAAETNTEDVDPFA